MKNILIASALLAGPALACAQSSITVFGIVDTGVSYFKVGGKKAILGVHNSGDLTSRIGFRGMEDLGNGMKASFWLESPILTDTGSGTGAGNPGPGIAFMARSTVSLSGSFGELRLGRDTSRAYEDIAKYDTFLQAGIGEVWAFGKFGSPLRYSNMVAYFTPKMAGFHGALDWAFGKNSGDSNGDSYIDGGRYVSAMVGYEQGPLSVSFAVENMGEPTSYTQSPVMVFDKERSAGLALSYDFGVLKLSSILRQQRNDFTDGSPQMKMNTAYLGAAFPVNGRDILKVSYNYYNINTIEGKANQLALGYVHTLSKRTMLYGTYAYMRSTGKETFALGVKGMPASTNVSGHSQNAFSVGIRHSF